MVSSAPLQAVVLAGTRDAHLPLLAGTGLQNKALLNVGGRPMLAHALSALASSRFRPKLYVSSNDAQVLAAAKAFPTKTLPSENSAVRSILKSLERLPGQEHVLFVSGDHALLTAEMVDHFVEASLARQLTFSAAVVESTLVREQYPESRRTWFKVKGGAYSGGNMFLVDKRTFAGRPEFMEMIDSNRKKPWKNVFRLHPLAMARILLRQADIHEIARHACGLFDCEVGVVEMPFAECCMDVDKPSDREMAERILAARLAAAQPVPLQTPLGA